jgi:hypothetical protein
MSLILFGCDEVEEGIIDYNIVDFGVTEIEALSNLVYSGIDTKLNTSITITDSEFVLGVWIKVASQDGTIGITNHLDMSKTTENKYSASIAMNEEMPSIVYTIDYFYETENQTEKKIASHNFTYQNMQGLVAPIISNPMFYYLWEEPSLLDTIKNSTGVELNEFILSIEVADSNGINDIDSVYVDLYNYQNPNSPTKTPKIPLFDDGNDLHADLIARDGIYSRKGYFPATSEGDRKFEFVAIDRAGLKSNIVTHNFVVVK